MSGLKQQIEKKIHNAYISLDGMTPTQYANVDNGLAKLKIDVLGLLADYVCIPRKQLEELFDNRPSSCCDVHSAEPMEYENWICMLREKLLEESK